MRDGLEVMFTAASRPTRVRVSTPLREPVGTGWTACVRAEISSVTGQPLTRTYRRGIRGDRTAAGRGLENDENCTKKPSEPI